MAALVLTEEDVRAILRDELAQFESRILAAARPAEPADVDTAEAARIAGVTPETVRTWIKRRRLPAHRPPGSREHRISRADLIAFLATPAARRPPPSRAAVDLAALARDITDSSRRR